MRLFWVRFVYFYDLFFVLFCFWAQLFTSLMADLCQDINRVSSLAGVLFEHFLEGIALLRHY